MSCKGHLRSVNSIVTTFKIAENGYFRQCTVYDGAKQCSFWAYYKKLPNVHFRQSFSMTTSPPRKPKNQDVRSREHLTPDEVELLIHAAKQEGRNGHRDATLILVMYRHGLRTSEAIALRWDQVDLKQGTLHVNRMKRG
ncbi:MAG TPA: tyrosine-type recombinase/integrase, partial [Phormidium sp.]